jgi:hypothetical protein
MLLYIRRLAVALWLISLVVPTSTSQNGVVAIGLQVALGGLSGLVFMFPIGLLGAPLQAISLLSNWLVLGEIRRQLKKSIGPLPLCNTLILVSAAVLNVFIGQHAKPLYPDLMSHPGFYLWASSFVLLASSGAFENRLFFGGLLKRSFALGAVAAVVFFIGLAAIIFSH